MSAPTRAGAHELLESADDSLLDLVDNLLNRGVVISGEVMLGLAGVDLVYLRLQAVLCAADRVRERAGP
jgi:gas vesicle protein GvpA/GvpJ/GvpM family